MHEMPISWSGWFACGAVGLLIGLYLAWTNKDRHPLPISLNDWTDVAAYIGASLVLVSLGAITLILVLIKAIVIVWHNITNS